MVIIHLGAIRIVHASHLQKRLFQNTVDHCQKAIAGKHVGSTVKVSSFGTEHSYNKTVLEGMWTRMTLPVAPKYRWLRIYNFSNPEGGFSRMNTNVPCYMLNDPSFAKLKRSWYDPRIEDSKASELLMTMMRDLRAQYFRDMRESGQATSMFLETFTLKVEKPACCTIFNYDDPKGGVWALDDGWGITNPTYEEVSSAVRGKSQYEVFEELGALYYDRKGKCPDLVHPLHASALRSVL